MIDVLPPGSSITLPRDWLAAELGVASDAQAPETIVDFTVDDVGKLIGRKPPTIRMWCEMGLFPQAYKLLGKQWRIPRTSFEEFQKTQRTHGAHRQSVMRPAQDTGSLSDWRKY